MEEMRNIINAKVTDAKNGVYLLNAADGSTYELPAGAVEITNGQLVPVGDGNQYLKLILPDDIQTLEDIEVNYHESEKENFNAGVGDEKVTANNTKAEWPDSPTKLLIELYREKKELVEQRKIKTIKRMWFIIQEGINSHGYNYTAAQCENKWKTLERAFKNKTESNNKTGRGRKACAYERELSDILIDRASVIPPAVMDAKRVKYGEETIEEIRVEIPESSTADTLLSTPTSAAGSEDARSATPTPGTCNTPRSRSVTAKELINLRKAIEKRTEEKKNADDRRYIQREKMIEQLERRNDLLEKLIAQQK